MKKHKIVPMIEKLEFILNRVARKFCRRRKKNFAMQWTAQMEIIPIH